MHTLIRTPTGLIPGDSETADYLGKVRVGDTLNVEFRLARNPAFHRKYFALLKYGYDHWSPELPVVHGEQAQKNFTRFRKDIVILTGRFERDVRLDGSVRLEAKSISFGRMDEAEFESLYSDTIDVMLRHIFADSTREDVDQVVERILEFDG